MCERVGAGRYYYQPDTGSSDAYGQQQDQFGAEWHALTLSATKTKTASRKAVTAMAPNPSATSLRAARYLGALLLIATGVVHLQQYFGVSYRVIPVIGPLFVANFVIGLALGLALLAPIERVGSWAPALAAVGGIAFAAGTIIGLEISESGTLFGFHEHGYRLAIILSIIFEGAAIVLLSAYLLSLRREWRARRHAGVTPRPAVPARDQEVTRVNRPR